MNILICYHSKLKDVISTQPGWTEEQLKRASDAFLNVYEVFEQNHKFLDYTGDDKEDILSHDGMLLRLMGDEATEPERLSAVRQNGLAIKYLTDPSETVCQAAVTNNGTAILYINNPSVKVQELALEWFIKHPDDINV